MKNVRTYRLLAVFACILVLLFALAACSGKAVVSFEQDTYTLYLDENDSFVPVVNTKQKKQTVQLGVANPTMLMVLSDNKTIRAISGDCYTYITATVGDAVAKATVLVYETRLSNPARPPASRYEVYFETFGRGGVQSQFVEPGGTADFPGAYSIDGYGVGEWYIDEALTTPYNFADPVTDHITLYAKWMPLTAPEFKFVKQNDGYHITGLKYPLIPHETITLPDTHAGEPVVGIYANAFANANLNIGSIVIPATVTTIGKAAFLNRTTLQSVFFDGESALTTIADEAFSGCTNLEDMTLPLGVTTLGTKSFYGCKSWALPTLPSGITVIPEDCFNGAGIEAVNLINVTAVHQRAFYNSQLAEPSHSENLVLVEALAFSNSVFAKKSANPQGLFIFGDVLLAGVGKANVANGYNMFVEIPAHVRLIANACFSAEQYYNGVITFLSTTAPMFNNYAIPEKPALALAVPSADCLADYYEKGRRYRDQFVVLDTITSDDCAELKEGGTLQVYVNTGIGTNPKKNLYVQSLKADLATTIDLNELFLTRYGTNFEIRKIKANAFKANQALVEVVLPPRILSMESYAFVSNPKLVSIKIKGEFGDFSPEMRHVTARAVQNNVFIHVPKDKLELYNKSWGKVLITAVNNVQIVSY